MSYLRNRTECGGRSSRHEQRGTPSRLFYRWAVPVAIGAICIVCPAGGAARADTRHLLAMESNGEGGLVTVEGQIGVLRIDRSRVSAIRGFAGAPDFFGRGTFETPRGALPDYLALGYKCSRRESSGADPTPYRPSHMYCHVIYYVNSRTGLLSAFWTNDGSFRTSRGVVPGMSQERADHLEGLTPNGGVFVGIRTSGKVASLLIGNRSCRPKIRLGSILCLGGAVSALVLESKRFPVGLLVD